MISSEVQRTLVKSPPELWAELSDPASLGRHLGELGEIRITRIEPEHKVEWEAGDTSGTVQIKASGWGTRVTLTATRELPEAEAAPAEPVDETDAADAPGEGEELPAPFPDAVPPAPEDVSAIDAHGVAEAEAGPESFVEPVPAVQADSPWQAGGNAAFAPQTPAAAWAKRGQAHEQRDYPPAPAAADVADAADSADAADDADDLEGGRFAWMTYEAEEPEPRRGFLARLFGRRRRPDPEWLDEPTAMEPLDEPTAIGPLDEPTAIEPLEQPAEQPEELPAEVEELPQADEPMLETREVPLETGAVALQADAVTESEVDSPEPAGESTAEPASIAADLIAAEDGAKAEVTALLTSVLDRLGAAHHRPFSRS